MFRIKPYLFLSITLLLGSLWLPGSNEPSSIAWSPLLDLTNYTAVTSIEYTAEGRAHVLTPRQELRLFEGLRRLEIDDALYWMNGPLVYLDEAWQISKVDLEQTLAPLVSKMPRPIATQPFVVVIDPGHGGHDPGAVVDDVHEKDIVLHVSLILQKKLAAKGATSLLTRTNDTFIALEERPVVARQLGASIFVSVHANQASSSFAAGIESFILPAAGFPGTSNSRAPYQQSLTANRFDIQNLLLADALHRHLIKRTGAFDRGIKRERFAVLRDAPCPALLVEIGFMSNPTDFANLRNPHWIDKLTDALCDGILAYMPATGDEPL
ncbi:MAG: N-acetylmuramoyl-L-alanine amidase family protein [Kiritimatiellia bacterium]